jgi:hypothetical protein
MDGPPRERRAAQPELGGPRGRGWQGGVPPAQRVGGRVRRGVGQDRQHVGLGVPEAVPVVTRPGQPLGRDGPALGPGGSLQHVEQREPRRLLDLRIPLQLHVSAVPERVQVGPLRGGQAIPAGLHGHGERRVRLVTDRGQRPVTRPAVGHELDQPQPLPGLECRRHRHPAQVREALRPHLRSGRPVDNVVHHRSDQQAAAPGGVHQPGARAARRVLPGGQRRPEHGRDPGITARRGKLLVGHELGLHRHRYLAVEGLHVVADGRDRPLREGHQPGRGHPDCPPGRGDPVGGPAQCPGPEVQAPLMGPQLPVADVERRVVHQEPDQLAVRHVDHCLPGLREAVARFRVRQRPQFVDAVQVRPRQPVRLALIQGPAPADVPVGQREDRLGLRQHRQVQAGLPQPPRLGRERRMTDHRPPDPGGGEAPVTAPRAVRRTPGLAPRRAGPAARTR